MHPSTIFRFFYSSEQIYVHFWFSRRTFLILTTWSFDQKIILFLWKVFLSKLSFSASILSCSLAWKWLEANLHASLKLNKLKWNLPKRRRRWDFPSSSSKLSFLSKFAQPKTNMKFILNLTQTLPYFFLIFGRQKSKFQVRKRREGKTLKNLHNNVAWVSERKTFELVGAEQGDGKSFTGSLEFIARLFLYYEHDKLHLLFSL